MKYAYRVIWYDWQNDCHVAFFMDFEDATSYAGDILDCYTSSHISSIEYYDLQKYEYAPGNPHPRTDLMKEKET